MKYCGDALTYWTPTENHTLLDLSMVHPEKKPITMNHLMNPSFHDKHRGGSQWNKILIPRKKTTRQRIYLPVVGVFRKFLWQIVSGDGHFCHFWGIFLCYAKGLQFYLNENKNIREQFSKYYILPCCTFFNLWSCWFCLRGKNKFPVMTAPFSF